MQTLITVEKNLVRFSKGKFKKTSMHFELSNILYSNCYPADVMAMLWMHKTKIYQSKIFEISSSISLRLCKSLIVEI